MRSECGSRGDSVGAQRPLPHWTCIGLVAPNPRMDSRRWRVANVLGIAVVTRVLAEKGDKEKDDAA